jgi:hypothetical protein
MIKGLSIYAIGLGLSLGKVYYDTTYVGTFNYKILLALIPDLLLILAVIFSFINKTKLLSFILALISVGYFDLVLGLNGKGSAQLSCKAVDWCQVSVEITCEKLNNQEWSGAGYLAGTGLKIMASTYIAKCCWNKYAINRIVPEPTK